MTAMTTMTTIRARPSSSTVSSTRSPTPLRGTLIREGDHDYDQARALWNGMTPRHPAAIARCAGTDDVRRVVRFAAERDLLLAVRGGGHNVAGTAVSTAASSSTCRR
jgi:FAD/FMN-containing dehydrogenase